MKDNELVKFTYHGALTEDVKLDFGDQWVTLRKNIEYVIVIVKKSD